MTKNTNTTAPVPAFVSVPLDGLPAATKSANAETRALGAAIVAAMTDGNAAQDPTAYADRKDAVKRAAVLRRAVRAVNGPNVGSRIYAEGDSFRVAIVPKPTEPEPERGTDLAE